MTVERSAPATRTWRALEQITDGSVALLIVRERAWWKLTLVTRHGPSTMQAVELDAAIEALAARLSESPS